MADSFPTETEAHPNDSINVLLAKLLKAVRVGLGISSGNSSNAISAFDAGPGWATSFGVNNEPVQTTDLSVGAGLITDAPTSGQKIVLTDIEVSVDTDMVLTLMEQVTGLTGGRIIGVYYLAANTTVNLITRGKRKMATANKRVLAQSNVAGNISIGAFYYSEA